MPSGINIRLAHCIQIRRRKTVQSYAIRQAPSAHSICRHHQGGRRTGKRRRRGHCQVHRFTKGARFRRQIRKSSRPTYEFRRTSASLAEASDLPEARRVRLSYPAGYACPQFLATTPAMRPNPLENLRDMVISDAMVKGGMYAKAARRGLGDHCNRRAFNG